MGAIVIHLQQPCFASLAKTYPLFFSGYLLYDGALKETKNKLVD
jgi:hypothetical protein